MNGHKVIQYKKNNNSQMIKLYNHQVNDFFINKKTLPLSK